MKRKIKNFKIACYVNLCSVLLVIVIFIYQTHQLKYSQQDLIDFIWLFLVIMVYAVNFYYGITLTSFLNKELNTVKINQKIRKIFFVLEIIATVFYSFLVYYSVIRIKLERFWPINFSNFLDIIVLLCLYSGYMGSLIRIFLTKSVIRIISLQDKQIVEQLGKSEN